MNIRRSGGLSAQAEGLEFRLESKDLLVLLSLHTGHLLLEVGDLSLKGLDLGGLSLKCGDVVALGLFHRKVDAVQVLGVKMGDVLGAMLTSGLLCLGLPLVRTKERSAELDMIIRCRALWGILTHLDVLENPLVKASRRGNGGPSPRA